MACLLLSLLLALSLVSPLVQANIVPELGSCLNGFSIPDSLVGSPSYNDAAAAYNLRLHPSPIGVAFPKSTQEVSDALSCASKYNIPVGSSEFFSLTGNVTCEPNIPLSTVTRSGGHSYAAFGLGGEQEPGALTIDMKHFRSFSYDDATTTATFGPGLRLGDLALALNDHGRALPHGTCPTVGSGGHASFGG